MGESAAAAILTTFHYARPDVVSMHNAKGVMLMKSRVSGFGKELVSSSTKRAGNLVSCVKKSDAAVIHKSNGSTEKSTSRGATFPSGYEELVVGVCDETQIAELKIKIGDFEMHLKRNINKTAESPVSVVSSPTEPPPIPSKPMTDFAPVPSPPPSGNEKSNPFMNESAKKSRKLAALEASGATGYVFISSPTVGSFRKCRTLKGKKLPPACKEESDSDDVKIDNTPGDMIKEEQTICFLDQFGTELPVKSDVAGEVIKILFDDGEAVGYGDPLIAVLPSFHDILAV